MISDKNHSLSQTGNEELAAILEPCLSRHFNSASTIIELRRRPVVTASTCGLEELGLGLEGGKHLALLVKDLSPQGMLEKSRNIKPAFVLDPEREIEVYERLLADRNWGTASCLGSLVDAAKGRYWLFLERVEGVELYQIGDFGIWQEAAKWLANMHRQFADTRVALRPAVNHMMVYDARLYRTWANRACEFLAHDPSARSQRVRSWIANRYEQVVDRLVALPTTFVHGEYYASNILVRSGREDHRICPIDWDMAGWGTGLLDLAALIAGNWRQEEKDQIASSYYEVSPCAATETIARDDFVLGLEFCRLHLALQWLGWAAAWTPPEQHANDWLGEADFLIGRTGI